MKYLIILTFSLSSMLVFGQKQQPTGKPIKKDNFLVDVHFSSLLNSPAGVHFDFGYGASFQLMYDYQFKAKVLSGAIGIAYSNDNYYTNGYLSTNDSVNGDYSTFYPFHTLDSNIKRSKYVTNYFDIPIELRFRSHPNHKGHSWKAAVGFRVGFALGSHTRTQTNDGRFQNYNYNDLRNIRYVLTGRFGYGRMGFVYSYNISRLFEDDRGHELIPWTAGITISPW